MRSVGMCLPLGDESVDRRQGDHILARHFMP